MNPERREELLTLYALGELEGPEADWAKRQIDKDDDAAALVADIQDVSGQLGDGFRREGPLQLDTERRQIIDQAAQQGPQPTAGGGQDGMGGIGSWGISLIVIASLAMVTIGTAVHFSGGRPAPTSEQAKEHSQDQEARDSFIVPSTNFPQAQANTQHSGDQGDRLELQSKPDRNGQRLRISIPQRSSLGDRGAGNRAQATSTQAVAHVASSCPAASLSALERHITRDRQLPGPEDLPIDTLVNAFVYQRENMDQDITVRLDTAIDPQDNRRRLLRVELIAKQPGPTTEDILLVFEPRLVGSATASREVICDALSDCNRRLPTQTRLCIMASDGRMLVPPSDARETITARIEALRNLGTTALVKATGLVDLRAGTRAFLISSPNDSEQTMDLPSTASHWTKLHLSPMPRAAELAALRLHLVDLHGQAPQIVAHDLKIQLDWRSDQVRHWRRLDGARQHSDRPGHWQSGPVLAGTSCTSLFELTLAENAKADQPLAEAHWRYRAQDDIKPSNYSRPVMDSQSALAACSIDFRWSILAARFGRLLTEQADTQPTALWQLYQEAQQLSQGRSDRQALLNIMLGSIELLPKRE